MNNWRLYTAEFLLTFTFVLVGCTAACLSIVNRSQFGALGVSAALGLVVAIMMFTFAQLSGRHKQAPVRTGELVESPRQFPVRRLLAYVGCQVAGVWLASSILTLVFPAVARAGLKIMPGLWLQTFVVEVVVLAVIMMLIMAVLTDRQALVQAEALAISGVSVALAITSGPRGGGFINPAGSLGPALANSAVHTMWLYALGPVIGAIIGAYAHKLLRAAQVKAEELRLRAAKLRQEAEARRKAAELERQAEAARAAKAKPPEPLAAPTELKVATPTKQPMLSWQAVDKADHYEVYRDGQKVTAVAATTLTDSGVSDGDHEYYIKAVDTRGLAGKSSAHLNVLVDRTGPHIAAFGPLTKVELEPLSLHVEVKDAATGVAAGEYFVGVADPGAGAGTPLSIVNDVLALTTNDQTLMNLPAGTHLLNIRAQDGLGNWTQPAVTCQLTVTKPPEPVKPDDTPLPAPMNVTAISPTRLAPVLSWSPVAEAALYQIWKRDLNTRITTQVGTSTKPTFTDQYESGMFNYVVIAVNGARKSEPSVPATVSVINNSSLEVQEFMAKTRPEVIPQIDSTKR